jgi:hypothetical protein
MNFQPLLCCGPTRWGAQCEIPHQPVLPINGVVLNAGFRAGSGRSRPSDRTRGIDPQRPFITSPLDVRIGWGADIRSELLPILISSSRQRVEQYLRLFQIGVVEPLGEPTVDRRQAGPELRRGHPGRGAAGTRLVAARATSSGIGVGLRPGCAFTAATSRSWQK